MTCDSSSSSAASQDFSLISFTAFSVPLRQGVHWLQDSSSKKRMRLRAAAFKSSLSERITTACEPTKLLTFSSWPNRSAEHTSELQSLIRLSYAVFYLNT